MTWWRTHAALINIKPSKKNIIERISDALYQSRISLFKGCMEHFKYSFKVQRANHSTRHAIFLWNQRCTRSLRLNGIKQKGLSHETSQWSQKGRVACLAINRARLGSQEKAPRLKNSYGFKRIQWEAFNTCHLIQFVKAIIGFILQEDPTHPSQLTIEA